MRRDWRIGHGLTEAYGVAGHCRISAVVGIGRYLVVDAVRPVVLRHLRITAVHVARNIILAPYVPHLIPHIGVRTVMVGVLRSADVGGGNTLSAMVSRCSRTRLEVIVDNVHRHGFATVATVGSPVVDDIVAQVHAFVLLSERTRTKTRRARSVVGYQVVMIRGSAATPVAAIAVGTFLMSGIVEALAHNAPLHGEVTIAVDRQTLVNRPADAAVVDDDIMTVTTSKPVAFVMGDLSITQSETYIAYDIIGTDHNRIVGQTDPVTWGSLSCYCRVLRKSQRRFQEYRARNIENNGLGSFLFVGPAQGARLVAIL